MASGIDITKSIRQTLVKSWLDMGKIRLQVAGGTVIIRGRIVKNRGGTEAIEMLILLAEEFISQSDDWPIAESS